MQVAALMACSRGVKVSCVNEMAARRWRALVLLLFSGMALATTASAKSSGALPEPDVVTSPASASARAAEQPQTSARQAAENAYRRALLMLQEGRISAAIATLEQALRSAPRHDAARQTLIGLLLEAKRTDEAMQQLQQALNLDQNQPALAMMLARLQVEQGGPALQTLIRSLPCAQDDAAYQGFVAALLQRAQRHAEAVEHYTTALQLNPANGIWWIGLGISLQAQKNLAGAKEAFQKAKASASLGGDLSAFVDKKLVQLGR